jgi:glycosyltransferase involved in cell wall biosynthesis
VNVRVLHLSAGNLFGGIERMLLGIATGARGECTHEFAVCFDGRLARELRSAGAAPHVLGDVRFRRPDTVWRARRMLKQLLTTSPPAAVIAHAPWSCVLATPVARRAGVPLLMWVHDAPSPDEWAERRVARLPPAHFICNSHYTARLVTAWLPEVRRDVIYPPVYHTPPVSAEARRAIRDEFGASDTTTVILLAARLEAWKGHALLIEAATRLRGDVVVWIAGGAQRPSEAAYLARLWSLAADPSCAARVRFLGERTDVPQLMAAADIYCQPNTRPEPFGVVLVEALDAQRPVVTTGMGGAAEIVDDRCGILVGTPTAANFARALQRLVDDRALRATLGATGPAHARRVSDPATRLQQICAVVRAQRQRPSAA